MKRMIVTVLAVSAGMLFLIPVTATEHTRYVVDQLVITLRDQPLGQGEVIHRLITGDAMVVTGQTSDDFIEVELSNGLKGWVDGRYITDAPIARVELESALAESRAAQAETEESLVRLSDDYRLLNEELTELRSSAGLPSDFEERVDQLNQELASVQETADWLDRKNKELKESQEWRWILSGAGTLAVGIFLGFVIPRRRRRSSLDNL